MTTFVYKAKKDTAETVTGTISARNEEEAIELINQLGFLPVSVVSEQNKLQSGDLKKPKNIKSKQLYTFSRQLANLLKSGVSILDALVLIEQQWEGVYFKNVLEFITQNIKDGHTFSETLEKFPHIFSPLYITMIKAGEESGSLQEMLLSIAEYQRKQDMIISKVKMAMTYPAFIGTIGLFSVYFVLTFVLPKMMGLFENIGDALPLPTVILITISDALSKGWLIGLLIIASGLFVFNQFLKTAKGKFVSSRFMLHMPLFGDMILKAELSRFTRTLALLLESGVSIVEALENAIPVFNNDLLKVYFKKCKDNLVGGGSLGKSIRAIQETPPMMGHLIAIAEESGNLNEVLNEIADNYEGEMEERMRIITTLLEPVMILFVGLIVGFIVFAMLLPIFQVDILAGA